MTVSSEPALTRKNPSSAFPLALPAEIESFHFSAIGGPYFCLTDAEGTYHLEIDLVYVNTDQLVCPPPFRRRHFTIACRLRISAINIPALLFPAPGRLPVSPA